MVYGTASRAAAATAGDLATLITSCGSDQAIALGTLKPGLPDPVTITTERKLKENPGAIARTREFIDYVPGSPGWALIDFDLKGMPPNVVAAIEAAGGMWNALLTVAPGLQRAARVSRASTSAGLYRTDTGEQFAGSGGAHHYVLVKDAGDIERFLRDLHDRCWLHGLGWHLIGRAGQLLDRSLVDRMVAYGERLCFEGAPIIEPPLAQDPSKRIAEAFEGEAIDTGLVVPRLTEYERHRVQEAKAASAEALGKAAAEIRSRHDRTLAEKISAKFGMPLSRRCGWSRRAIAGFCCRTSNWSSIIWASCRSPMFLLTPIGISARRWPTRWKASTTVGVRPKSCGPTMAACSSTASPTAAGFTCSATICGRLKLN